MTLFAPARYKVDRPRTAKLRYAPVFVLAAVLCMLPLALVVTIPQPIGPMFWDQYLYLDATNRIADGQIPSVDFFAPVGALGYYLFTLLIHLFPAGHPLLLSSWSLLIVSGPLMALVLLDVERRSPATAFALLAPFLFFSILPFNLGDFFPFPGSEGFGIYNRQVCQLLYVLAAALLFMRDARLLCIAVATTMLALVLVKITGAVAGALMCLMAFSAGRLSVRTAVVAGLAFAATLGVLELTLGMISAYCRDILALVAINTTSLLPRLLQAASLNFGAAFFAGLAALLFFAIDRKAMRQAVAAVVASPSPARIAAMVDWPCLWIATFTLAGIFFESQNTGSQALIFLWPLVLAIAIERFRAGVISPGLIAAGLAGMAVVIPQVVIVVQKSARAWIGAVENIPLESRNLKTMGAVNIRAFMALRSERMRAVYVDRRETYADIAAHGEHASFLLFSEYDFQIGWLEEVDNAISALQAYETAHGVRFETILNIDFTNPYPWLMDRHAPKYVTIGADPFRAVPPASDKVKAAVAAVDIAILPTCPITTTRNALLALYQPSLAGHTRMTLTPCADAFVRNDLVREP